MNKHELKIVQQAGKTEIYLDGFKMKGVMSYEVKSSDHNGMAELSLKIHVARLQLGSNDGGNNFGSDLGDGAERS